MAEYARAGLDEAQVEDIVAAAGVSWGTFFHYFPTKEDVLLEASATVCQAYAEAAAASLESGADTAAILASSFAALFRSARQVAASAPLRGAMLRQVVNHPGRLTAYPGDDVPTPIRVTAEVLAEGQRRGEVRGDQPAEADQALAVIVLYAVLFSVQRGTAIGRPPGAAPLSALALEILLRGMRPGPELAR